MASYTAVGTAQNPSMTVSFKMDITTYGPHNGVFITSGIQQGTNFQGFVAATQGQNMVTHPVTPIPAITGPSFGGSGGNLSVAGSQSGRTTTKPDGDKLNVSTRSRSTSRSRPSSPTFHFGRESPPDEFIGPDNFRVNTFDDDKKLTTPYVQYPTDYVLNDTTTTTTTVEVFRAKVNRNDPVDFFELPPDPLGPDNRPQLVRAVGPPYEVATKTETRFGDQPVVQSSPGQSRLVYSPVPKVQWGSSQDRLGESRASSRQGRIEGPSSNYSGSLERNRSLGGSIQSRQPFVEGDYQTTITRRQFHERKDERLQNSRPVSPSPSAGRVYPIPIERDYERGPRPLRHTISQPDVFDDYYKRGRRRQSPEVGYHSRSRGTSPDPYRQRSRTSSPANGLRRARSRSETRSDEGRPLSRAESWESSVNNIFKLYQTRDCLGNVVQELPPSYGENEQQRPFSFDGYYSKGDRSMDSGTSVRETRSKENILSPVYGHPENSQVYGYPSRPSSYYDQKENFPKPSTKPKEPTQSTPQNYNQIEKSPTSDFKHEKDYKLFKDRPLPPEPRVSPLNSSTDSIIEDTSPRKEKRKYDKEMIETEIPPILKSERGPKPGDDGRRSRVEFVEPEPIVRDSSTSPIGDVLESIELRADAPIVGEEDFGTPRSSKSSRRVWIEKPKKIGPIEDRIEEIKERPSSEGKYSQEAGMMEMKEPRSDKYNGPVCVEAKETVDYLPRTQSTDDLILPKRKEKKSDKLKKCSSTNTESDYLVPKSMSVKRIIGEDSSKPDSSYPYETATVSNKIKKVQETSAEDLRISRPSGSSSSKKLDSFHPGASLKPVEAFVHRMSVSPERQPTTSTFRSRPRTQSTHFSPERPLRIPVDNQFTSQPRSRSSSRDPPSKPYMMKERKEIQEVSKLTTVKTTNPEERLKLSQTASEQLAKSGWISSQRKSRGPSAPKTKDDDDWPLPPVIPPSYGSQEIKTNEVPSSLKPKSSLLTSEVMQFGENPRPNSSTDNIEDSSHFKSFSEKLKAQFSHTPSSSISSDFGVTSPAPKDTSSPMPPPPSFPTSPRSSFREKLRESAMAAKPPLPPGSRPQKLPLTKLEHEPRVVKPSFPSTDTSIPADSTFSPGYSSLGNTSNSPRFVDEGGTDDEPSFDLSGIGKSAVDPRIRVVSEGTKLHILGM